MSGSTERLSISALSCDETKRYLEVIRLSIRGKAAADYDHRVIEDWAPWPIKKDDVDRASANPERESRIAARFGAKIVGIGSVIPPADEFRACYVLPEATGQGVGRAIVAELEAIAHSAQCPMLRLNSSLTAWPFYERLGYKVREHSTHILSSGRRMPCVKMEKISA